MTAAAAFVVLIVALGIMRILHGPATADRMMGAQLLGSGGIAALLLRGSASGTPGVTDAVLVLALLAAFASVAFVVKVSRKNMGTTDAG